MCQKLRGVADMNKSIITDWQPEYAKIFSKQSLLLHHRLKETGLFERDYLAGLIERCPESNYNINTMGYDPENPTWREGTKTGMSGHDVIDAIERGRMWLNLRQLEKVDPDFDRLLTDIFEEFEGYVPEFETFKRKLGILISSPLVQVFYHADVPGQSLWQVEGEKRVYVYPNEAPFLEQKSIEGIILGLQEEEIPYERYFDDHAEVYDLKPGEMVHWPLNCPHRVENKDCLNISVTTEHWTGELRKMYAVNYANGVLRRKFGMNGLAQNTSGPGFYAKAGLAVAWRGLKLDQGEKIIRKVDFRVDPTSETGMSDIESYAKHG